MSGAADLDAARADADEAHASARQARADADAAARQRAEESAAARRYNDVAAAKVREIEQRAEGAAREAAALRAAVAGAEARASSAENERRRAVEDAAEAVRLKARLEDAKNAADAACGAAASSASAAAMRMRRIRERPRVVGRRGTASRPGGAGRGRGARDGGPRVGARRGKRAVDAETSVADAVQRASEAEARLKALEEAMTGMSETGQAELAKLKSRLNDERKKSMTLVAENDAARDENEKAGGGARAHLDQ